MDKVLLIGSGKDVDQVRNWRTVDLRRWTIVAINNAWSVTIPHLKHHVRSGDWKPPAWNRPPRELYARVTWVGPEAYDGPAQRERFGRQSYGIGATMLWNAAYWCLGVLNPQVLGFIGCSMDYPKGQSNTFYGSGTPDPLRFPEPTLLKWFAKFRDCAEDRRCSLVNFGSPGLMPYPRRHWPEAPPT